jgi:hypothetical protein
LHFVLALALCAASLEACARGLGERLHACTNRGLYKLALLERRGPVAIVFLGSSRTQDGVSPRLFEDEAVRTAQRLPGGPSSFNLAFTATSLPSLEREAALLLERRQEPGRSELTAVLIELSSPQLEEGPVAWEEHPAPAADSAGGAALEAAMGAAARDHLAVVRDRAALIPENLGRLAALLAPRGRLDGSEVKAFEQLGAAFSLWTPADADAAGWRPPRVEAGPALPGGHPFAAAETRLEAVAQRFYAAGVVPVFVIPPLSPEAHQYGHDAEAAPRFQALAAALAARFRVLDGTRLTPPKSAFHDTTHLNARGRAGWSRGLARALTPEGQ